MWKYISQFLMWVTSVAYLFIMGCTLHGISYTEFNGTLKNLHITVCSIILCLILIIVISGISFILLLSISVSVFILFIFNCSIFIVSFLIVSCSIIRIVCNKRFENYTGRFIMYSWITKIYYRKTVGQVFTKPVQIEGTTQNFTDTGWLCKQKWSGWPLICFIIIQGVS